MRLLLPPRPRLLRSAGLLRSGLLPSAGRAARRHVARGLAVVLASSAALVGATVGLPAAPARAAAPIVVGCDPMTGQTVTRSLDELINPTRQGPTPQYVSPDRNGAIGTIWTPSCEPTSTTGNGTCFTAERNQIVAVEVAPALSGKLVPRLPAGLKLQAVWVVLRQFKNDGTSDFLTFFMVSPILTGEYKGRWDASVQAQYTHAWFALYRALDAPPAGSNLPEAGSVWKVLASYGQFLALGGITKDTSALNAGSFLGAPVLPPPFLTGQFDGGRVGASVAGTTVGLTSWAGPYAIDVNKADPTNVGAMLYGSEAPGGTPASIATIPGDIVKIQPDLVTTGSRLGSPVAAIIGSTFRGTPMSWLAALQASASGGIVLDQLDMSSFKTSTGIEQGAAIEMVIRVPLLLTLDFAPAGSKAAKEASTWWNSVKNDSKWAAWAKNARATANFTGGPYLGIRYTKKVDLAGRTPGSEGNLALWKDIKRAWGFAPTSVAALFGPDGSAAIQLYGGALVRVGNPLGMLSVRLPGTKTVIGPGDLTGLRVGATVEEQYHTLLDAWHNTPGRSGVAWKTWEGCTGQNYGPDPGAAIYGPKFRSSFSPGPHDVYNPAAPRVDWPTSPGLKTLSQPLLDDLTTTFVSTATEVSAAKSLASQAAATLTAAASTAATWIRCKIPFFSCPYKTKVLQTDAGTLDGRTTRFVNDEVDARAGHDGWCRTAGDAFECTVYDGNGAPQVVFPAEGSTLWWGGRHHRASRKSPAPGSAPYCVPEWYRVDGVFHSTVTAFTNDPVPPNRYHCAFWSG